MSGGLFRGILGVCVEAGEDEMRGYLRWDVVGVMIVVIGFFFIQQSADAGIIRLENALEKQARILTVLLSLSLLIVIVLAKRYKILFRNSVLSVFYIYVIFCALSVIVSQAPEVSGFKVIELVVVGLVVVAGVNNKSSRPLDFLRFVINLYFFIIVSLLIQAILYPSEAFKVVIGETPFLSGMLKGVYPELNPNTVGYIAGVLSTASFAKLLTDRNGKSISSLYLIIGLAAIVLSYSRSAALSFLVVAVVLMVVSRRYGIMLYIVIPFGIYVAYEYLDLLVQHFLRGRVYVDADGVLSGRVSVWDMSLVNLNNFLLGEGFGTGFRAVGLGGSTNAHNSMLEILFNAGIFALIAWLAIFFKLGRIYLKVIRASSALSMSDKTIFLGVLLYMMISTLTNTRGVYMGWDMLPFIGLVIFADRYVYWMRRRLYNIKSRSSPVNIVRKSPDHVVMSDPPPLSGYLSIHCNGTLIGSSEGA